jgi:alkylhydroperoxidase/carboxymuconolactone decarboxylase family protein
VHAIFDAVPALAAAKGWGHREQGGSGTPVYCCHTEVQAKHWVYPNDGSRQSRPIEFAYGALVIHDAKMGCDLRPIDPAHPQAAAAREALAACAASHATAEDGTANGQSTYYRPADLAHFKDMGNFAAALMDKFWDYYTEATAKDGALNRREKALIALAVAHSKQCPYCIDAYTNTLVNLGVSTDEMHEAIHVAAALGAGIDLVHGVQMQNVLRARGAL